VVQARKLPRPFNGQDVQRFLNHANHFARPPFTLADHTGRCLGDIETDLTKMRARFEILQRICQGNGLFARGPQKKER
jgi:hypothetical protein